MYQKQKNMNYQMKNMTENKVRFRSKVINFILYQTGQGQGTIAQHFIYKCLLDMLELVRWEKNYLKRFSGIRKYQQYQKISDLVLLETQFEFKNAS